MNKASDEIGVPDVNNLHNYMLDTTAYNDFANDEQLFALVKSSLLVGFRYYKTANQDKELNGWGAKVYDDDCLPKHFKMSDEFKLKIPRLKEIGVVLEVKRVSSLASLMHNHVILDGTYREYDDTSPEGKLADKILQFNEKLREKRPFAQHYDMMIAEAAIHHSCILVTNDRDLKHLMNVDFPQSAISTTELVEEIVKCLPHNS